MVKDYHKIFRLMLRGGGLLSATLMIAGLAVARMGEVIRAREIIRMAVVLLFLTPLSGLAVFFLESVSRRDRAQGVLIVFLGLLLVGGVWLTGVL